MNYRAHALQEEEGTPHSGSLLFSGDTDLGWSEPLGFFFLYFLRKTRNADGFVCTCVCEIVSIS